MRWPNVSWPILKIEMHLVNVDVQVATEISSDMLCLNSILPKYILCATTTTTTTTWKTRTNSRIYFPFFGWKTHTQTINSPKTRINLNQSSSCTLASWTLKYPLFHLKKKSVLYFCSSSIRNYNYLEHFSITKQWNIQTPKLIFVLFSFKNEIDR